jgi:hypothetical protein
MRYFGVGLSACPKTQNSVNNIFNCVGGLSIPCAVGLYCDIRSGLPSKYSVRYAIFLTMLVMG